jgi:hypothetical protein
VATAIEEEAAGERRDREDLQDEEIDAILNRRFADSKDPARDRRIFNAFLTATKYAPYGSVAKVKKAVGSDFGVEEKMVDKIGNPKELVRVGAELGFSQEQIEQAFGITTKRGGKPKAEADEGTQTDEDAARAARDEAENAQEPVMGSFVDPDEDSGLSADGGGRASEKDMTSGLTEAGFDGEGGFGLDDSRFWQQASSSGNKAAAPLLEIAATMDGLRQSIAELEAQGLTNAVARLREAVAAQQEKLDALVKAATPAPVVPKREVGADLAAAKEKFKSVGRDVTKMERGELELLRGEAELFKNKDLLAKIDAQLGNAPAAEPAAEPAADPWSGTTRKTKGEVELVDTELLAGVDQRNKADTGTPEYAALKASIAKDGIVDPITITTNSLGKPEVFEGNHRLQAARELGIKQVPLVLHSRTNASESSPVVGRKPSSLFGATTAPKAEAKTAEATVATAPKEDSGQTLWDGLRKTSPDLVAYEDLTDNERGYLTELADRTGGKPKLKDELGLQELMGRTGPAAPKVETTDAQRKEAEGHAKDTGGTVVWQEGPLALIRGYSMLNGQPVYAVAKGSARSRVDVESFTGSAITGEEKTRLVQIKKDLEAADAAKHKTDPFIKFDGNGLATSKNMDSRLAGVVAGWKDLLNIKPNIYVTTLEDARADKDEFTGPHRSVGSAGLDANEAGSMRKMGDGYYIAFKKGTSYLKMLETLAHELGHVHQREAFDNADAATQKAIRAEHDKFVKANSGKTGKEFVQALRARTTGRATDIPARMQASELTPYWKSFSEWYADQVSKWATTSEKPVTVVEKFFSRLGEALKKFYYALKGQKYLPNETMKQFLDAIADRTIVIDAKSVNQDTRSESILAGTRSFVSQKPETVAEMRTRLAIAKMMDSNGESVDETWEETGWYRNGVDGKWRYEIPDTFAAFTQQLSSYEPNKKYLLSEVLEHQALFEKYPQLRDYTLVFDSKMPAGNGAFYKNGGRRIDISQKVDQDPYAFTPMQVLLHEVQHAIQEIEGFAAGGAPSLVLPYDLNSLKKLRNAVIQRSAKTLVFDIRPATLDRLIGLVDAYNKDASKLEAEYEALSDTATEADIAVITKKVNDAFNGMQRDYDALLAKDGLTVRQISIRLYELIAGEVEANIVAGRSIKYENELAVVTPKSDVSAENQLVNRSDAMAYSLRQPTSSVPSGVKPQVNILTRALRSAADAALNKVIFSEDLFKRAATMGLNAAREMDRIYRERAALTGNIEREVTRIENMFNRIPKSVRGTGEKSANRFLYDSTRENKWGFTPTWRGADASKAKVDPAMAARYNALPKEAQAWVSAVLEHGDKMLKLKKNTLIASTNSEYDALIADAKQRGETNKVTRLEKDKAASLKQFQRLFSASEFNPYAPMRRFGDFVVIGKSKAYLDATPAERAKMESDPDQYHVSFAESRASALELQRQLEDQGSFSEVSTRAKEDARGDMYGGLMDAFNKLRGNIESELNNATEPKEIAALRAARETVSELYLASLAENSSRKSEMRRRGVAGEIDMLRSFSTQGRADAHFLASAKYNPQTQEAVVKMRQQVKDGGNQLKKSEAFKEIMARHTQSMRYDDGGWFDAANNAARVTSIWFLATNPMYYFQNLTQPFVLSLPFMTGKHDWSDAAGQLMRSYFQLGDLLKSAKLGEGFDFTKVSKDKNEQDMILKLVDRGRIDIGMDTELGQVKLEGDSAAGRTFNRTDRLLRSASQKVEAVNRVSTALAAYRLERKAGSSHEAALEYADEVIGQTHGDYTRINAPRAFNSPMGKVALQFRKFQLIQLTLLTKLVYNSFKGATAVEKATARRILTYTLAHTGVLAGVVGMPGFAAAAFIANRLVDLFGDDDEPYNLENEMRKLLGGGEIAQVLMRGAPNLVGSDLSGKLGMGNALSILPFTDFEANREGFNAIAVGLTLGATGGLGARTFDALGDIKKGDYYRGLMGLAPTGFSQAIKAVVEADRGETNRRGDVLVSADEIATWESFAQAVGWPTTSVTERRFDRGVAFDNREAFDSRASKIKNEYTRAVRGSDSEARRKAIEKWQRLQNSRREAGFKPQPLSTLMRAPQEQAKRERNTAGGLQFNTQNRQFVQEQTAN